MRDLLGNQIHKGMLIHWKPGPQIADRGIPVRVLDVDCPADRRVQSIEEQNGNARMGRLVLMIEIPVPPRKDGAEQQLTDLMCLLDPMSQQLVEKLVTQ